MGGSCIYVEMHKKCQNGTRESVKELKEGDKEEWQTNIKNMCVNMK